MNDINSNNISNGKSFKVSMERTIDQANIDITDMPSLKDIVDLDSDLQVKSFKILWLAFKNIMTERISNQLDINLPYIGYLKIKYKNKFAIIHKANIAKELGYVNWIDIPRDKLEIALLKVKELTVNDIIEAKKQGVRKRVSHQPIQITANRPRVKVVKISKAKLIKINYIKA